MTGFLNGKSWTHSVQKLILKRMYIMDSYNGLDSSTALVFGLLCTLYK